MMTEKVSGMMNAAQLVFRVDQWRVIRDWKLRVEGKPSGHAQLEYPLIDNNKEYIYISNTLCELMKYGVVQSRNGFPLFCEHNKPRLSTKNTHVSVDLVKPLVLDALLDCPSDQTFLFDLTAPRASKPRSQREDLRIIRWFPPVFHFWINSAHRVVSLLKKYTSLLRRTCVQTTSRTAIETKEYVW